MTDEEIRALLASATPGPWERVEMLGRLAVDSVSVPQRVIAGVRHEEDARLIAAAPTLASELLAAREVVRQMAAWMRDANQVGYCEDGAFDSLPGSDEVKAALLASARAITEGKT